jgi:hypothetical protein
MKQENQQTEELFMTFQEKDAVFRYFKNHDIVKDEFVKLYFKYKNKPNAEELFEYYDVDFKKGILTNKKSGKESSCISGGYPVFRFKEESYHVHILIYAMYHKRWPKINMLVDHRDQNYLNNSISNLYEVTIKQNTNNKNIKDYKHGVYKRIKKDGSERYSVIRGGKYLGIFKTYEEAMARSLAYDKQLEEQGIKPVRSQTQ